MADQQTDAPKPYQPDEYVYVERYSTDPQGIELANWHKHFQVSQTGGQPGLIRSSARVIPYNSEKKNLGLLGRNGFAVYEYQFSMPGEKEPYTVMWDHEIGLVRITPFFKALGHIKTVPRKAIGANNKLDRVCHSITGGATAAQGYWVPYACARAICTTFCYKIRYALTPIFGSNFVQDCLTPGQNGFGEFKIAQRLVDEAIDEDRRLQHAAAHSARVRAIDSARSSEENGGSNKEATIGAEDDTDDGTSRVTGTSSWTARDSESPSVRRQTRARKPVILKLSRRQQQRFEQARVRRSESPAISPRTIPNAQRAMMDDGDIAGPRSPASSAMDVDQPQQDEPSGLARSNEEVNAAEALLMLANRKSGGTGRPRRG